MLSFNLGLDLPRLLFRLCSSRLSHNTAPGAEQEVRFCVCFYEPISFCAFSRQSVIAQWMYMDHWWNYIEGIREKASKQTQCHFQIIYSLTFHKECLGVSTSFRDESPATNVVSHGVVPFVLSDATVVETLHTVTETNPDSETSCLTL
jgi:hypothetical protein